jgi:predicted RNA-binding Zn ribbon-like protein
MPNSENKDLEVELEVVAGNPTAQELAAVVAVLREAESTLAQPSQAEPNWAKDPKMLRDTSATGALEWRSDFKGQI